MTRPAESASRRDQTPNDPRLDTVAQGPEPDRLLVRGKVDRRLLAGWWWSIVDRDDAAIRGAARRAWERDFGEPLVDVAAVPVCRGPRWPR